MKAFAGLVSSPTLATAAALFALYWVVAALVPNPPFLEALQGVRVSVGIAVTVVYGGVCLEALVADRLDRAQQLTLGIALAWTAAVCAGGWSLLGRHAGQPAWMLDSRLDGFWIWLQVLGGVLHLTAPSPAGGGNPARHWILLAGVLGIGALAGAAFAALQPDITLWPKALNAILGP